MRFFESSEERQAENKLYELVATEIERGEMSKGVWAKAISQSETGEAGAKRLYIKLRVQELTDELELEARAQEDRKRAALEEARKKAEEEKAKAKEADRQRKIEEASKPIDREEAVFLGIAGASFVLAVIVALVIVISEAVP